MNYAVESNFNTANPIPHQYDYEARPVPITIASLAAQMGTLMDNGLLHGRTSTSAEREVAYDYYYRAPE